MATSNLPSFNVYTVEERGNGEDPFWLKIGAAFAGVQHCSFRVSTRQPVGNARSG